MPMRTIGEILGHKEKKEVVVLEQGRSVLDAVQKMDAANTGSVVVLEDARVVGIFTERDLMRRVVLKGLDLARISVDQVMTRDLIYTSRDETLAAAMAKMTRHRCRHLPVVENERLAGLVSIGDLMKEISDEQSVEIEFLREYIYSRPPAS